MNLKTEKDIKDFRNKVKEYYDGYRFSPFADTYVYNPVSIGSFLKANGSNNLGFQNFWIGTGGMSTIRELISSRSNDFRKKQPWAISRADRSLMEVTNIFNKRESKENIYAYLFQCGYLTIVGVDKEERLLLGYPNEEVSSAIISMLINVSYGINLEPKSVAKLRNALFSEDIESIVESLNSLYSSLPWRTNPKALEGPFEGVLLTLLYAMGIGESIVGEESTSGGDSDIALKINSDLVYIIELKVNSDSDKALAQVKEKEYYKKYIGAKTIHLIGLNFSKMTRTIESFSHECVC